MIAESIVRSCIETAKLCAENHPQVRMSRAEWAACGIAMSLRHSKNVANIGDAAAYEIDKAHYLNALTSLGQHEVVQIISTKTDL